MKAAHGILIAILGVSFVMGWYGFAGFVMCLVGAFVVMTRF